MSNSYFLIPTKRDCERIMVLNSFTTTGAGFRICRMANAPLGTKKLEYFHSLGARERGIVFGYSARMMEMRMTDLREEIPQRAYINAEILQLATDTPAFRESINIVKGKYRLQEYDFMNPAYIISLLYCLLVVPREIWLKNGSNRIIYSEVGKCDSIRNFTIIIPENYNGLSVDEFLKHMRNSISHARFSIDQEMVFTFSDQFNNKESFMASISAKDLMKFISEIGAILANIRTREK